MDDSWRATISRGNGVVLAEGRTAPDYALAIKVVADALDAGAAPADVLTSVREDRPLRAGVPDVRGAFRGAR